MGWLNIQGAKRKKKLQTKFLYPAKLSFESEGKIKISPVEKKSEEFVTIRLNLQEIYTGVCKVKWMDTRK